MILVGQYDSFYVRRVAVSLHTLGVPFKRNTISVFADADEMRRINPLGRIPSLIIDEDEVLIDSNAILDYVDELVGPERALIPKSGPARRRALFQVSLATGAIDKAGAIVYERTLRPREKIYTPWIDRCKEQLHSALVALELAVPDKIEKLYQPEITIGCALAYIEHRLPEALDRHAYPRLEEMLAMCNALEPFQKTKPAADEVMPQALR